MYLVVHVWELKFIHVSTSALLKKYPVSFCNHFVLEFSQPGPFAYGVYQKIELIKIIYMKLINLNINDIQDVTYWKALNFKRYGKIIDMHLDGEALGLRESCHGSILRIRHAPWSWSSCLGVYRINTHSRQVSNESNENKI